MNILDRILAEMNRKDIQQKDLTSFLGIKETAFAKWKKGINTSYLKYISQIAEFLGVSTDYLLGNEQKEKSLSDEDKLLEDIVSILSSKNKEQLLFYRELANRLAKDE